MEGIFSLAISAVTGLWKMSLLACPIIIIVLVLGKMLHRYPKRYSYVLWILVFIRLLCPVFIESDYSLQPKMEFSMSSTESLPAENAAEGSKTGDIKTGDSLTGDIKTGDIKTGDSKIGDRKTGDNSIGDILPGDDFQTENISAQDQLTDSLNNDRGNNLFVNSNEDIGNRVKKNENEGKNYARKIIFSVLVIVYIIGVITSFIIHFIQYIKIRSKVLTAVHEEDNIWLCDEIDSPFVMGIISPKIFLPYGLGVEERRHIVMHEKSHIKHHDPLLRVITSTALCLHFWNPLVWIAIHKLNEDMEIYCDESFMLSAPLDEKRAYANALLMFSMKKSGLFPKLSFGESATEQRVKNVMQRKKRNRFIAGGIVLIAITAAVLLMTIPGSEAGETDASVLGIDTDNGSGDGANESIHGTDANGDTDYYIGVDSGNSSTGELQVQYKPSDEKESDIIPGTDDINEFSEKISLDQNAITFLEKMSIVIPEFWSASDRNAEFWGNLIFDLYQNDTEGETEDRFRFSEELGTTATYRKVSLEEIDELSMRLFGEKMTDTVKAPEIPMNTSLDIVYEDGYFFINTIGDGVAYDSSFAELRESVGGQEAVISLKHVDSDWRGTVIIQLQPAENEHGFIITGREMTPIYDSLEKIIEKQVYNIDMDSWGNVTFAIYEPAGYKQDINFALLDGEREIYNFALYDRDFYVMGLEFMGIREVAFPDCNLDGFIDIVVIADYYMESNIISQVRMYTGRADGSFLWEQHLVEEYNSTHDEKTMEDFTEFAMKPENRMLYKSTSILGCWKVNEIAGKSDIYALTEDEMNAYIGTFLTYERYVYAMSLPGEDEAEGTLEGYSTETFTKEELQETYRLNDLLDSQTAENYICYQVIGKKGSSSFGDTMIMLDSNKAYIFCEGVFYLAERLY